MAQAWKNYQRTGFEPMDDEHRRISDELESALEALNSNDALKATTVFTSLTQLIADHFAHEGRLMVDSHYPNITRHVEAHSLYLADARAMLGELKAHGLTEKFRRWLVGRGLEWFRFHIAAHDVGLGQFLAARKPAPSPALTAMREHRLPKAG